MRERLLEEIGERGEKRRQRLAGTGRRGDERVPPLADRFPSSLLRDRRLPEGFGKPEPDCRMKAGKGHGSILEGGAQRAEALDCPVNRQLLPALAYFCV